MLDRAGVDTSVVILISGIDAEARKLRDRLSGETPVVTLPPQLNARRYGHTLSTTSSDDCPKRGRRHAPLI